MQGRSKLADWQSLGRLGPRVDRPEEVHARHQLSDSDDSRPALIPQAALLQQNQATNAPPSI
jgi:hypothetical protein